MKRSEFLRLGLLSIVVGATKPFDFATTIFDDKPEHYYHVFKVSSAMLNDAKAFAIFWSRELLKVKKITANLVFTEKTIGFTNDDFIKDMYTVILKFKK